MTVLYSCNLRNEAGDVVAAYSGYHGEPTPVGGTFGNTDFSQWQEDNGFACDALRETCHITNTCTNATRTEIGDLQYLDSVTFVCGYSLVDCSGDCVVFTNC